MVGSNAKSEYRMIQSIAKMTCIGTIKDQNISTVNVPSEDQVAHVFIKHMPSSYWRLNETMFNVYAPTCKGVFRNGAA